MHVYIRRWHEDCTVTSEVFSKDVTRVSTWKSQNIMDFGDRIEHLLNVVVWFLDDRSVSFDDCIDVEVI